MEELRGRKLDLEEKVAANPGSKAFWVQLGNVCKELGDNNRAIDAYRKALEFNPDDRFTKNVLAQLEGKGVQRPTVGRKPTDYRGMPTPGPASGRMPGEWSKWTIPVGVLALLVLAGAIYKGVTDMAKATVFQIAPMDRNLMYPKISPDGNWIAFVANPTD